MTGPEVTQPDPDGGVEMTDGEWAAFRGYDVLEVTTAVERAGRAIWEHDNGHTTWPPRDPLEIGPSEDAARAALAAALDVGSISRAIADNLYGQDVRTLVMRRPGESYRAQAERIGQWAAESVLASVLGTDQ